MDVKDLRQTELLFNEASPKETQGKPKKSSTFKTQYPKDLLKWAVNTPFAKGIFCLAISGIVFFAGLVAVIYLFSAGLQVVAGGIRLIIEILFNHPTLAVILIALIGGLWIGWPEKEPEEKTTEQNEEHKDEEIF